MELRLSTTYLVKYEMNILTKMEYNIACLNLSNLKEIYPLISSLNWKIEPRTILQPGMNTLDLVYTT